MLAIALLVVALMFGTAAWQTVDLYGPALGMRRRIRAR